MNYDLLFKEINFFPIELQREVLDFIAFLKSKRHNQVTKPEREFGYAKGKIKIHRGFTPLWRILGLLKTTFPSI